MIRFDPEHVEAARQGSRVALAAIVRAAERPVYNLAVRMLAERTDAEDATQEILIKIITHLGSVREIEAAGAWALRVACRHLVRERKRGRIEAMRLTFEGFAEDLQTGLGPVPDIGLSAIETAMAIEEVKVGCTLAMLTCLTRDLRIAYLLGDVFELTDTEAMSVLEVSAPAYRQRLRRARAAVAVFVGASCGIATASAPCSCDRRIAPSLGCGRITRGQSAFGLESADRVDLAGIRQRVRKFEQGRAAAALLRSNPEFSTRIGDLVLVLLEEDLLPAP